MAFWIRQKRNVFLPWPGRLVQPPPGRMKVTTIITEAFDRQRQSQAAPSSLIVPQIPRKPGSTKHYPRYDVDNDPLVKAFVQNLTSFDGGQLSLTEARQIASDVSKYLAFANQRVCSWSSLLDEEKLKAFLTKVEKDNIGPEGMTTKIERLIKSLKYCQREKLLKDGTEVAIARLDAWKRPFAKCKPSLQVERGLKESIADDERHLDSISEFFEHTTLIDYIDKMMESDEYSDHDAGHFATYLFCALVYKNWQRPGAAINITLDEASAAKEERNGKLVVRCKVHKTGLAYGPAVMVLKGNDVKRYWHYLHNIRPKQRVYPSCANIFLLTATGRPLKN